MHFLTASRNGDFEGLLAVLDPDVVVLADDAAARLGGSREVRGAQAVAKAFMGRAQTAQSALINGVVGAVVAPRGRLLMVVNVTIANGRIVEINAVGDPDRLQTVRPACSRRAIDRYRLVNCASFASSSGGNAAALRSTASICSPVRGLMSKPRFLASSINA